MNYFEKGKKERQKGEMEKFIKCQNNFFYYKLSLDNLWIAFYDYGGLKLINLRSNEERYLLLRENGDTYFNTVFSFTTDSKEIVVHKYKSNTIIIINLETGSEVRWFNINHLVDHIFCLKDLIILYNTSYCSTFYLYDRHGSCLDTLRADIIDPYTYTTLHLESNQICVSSTYTKIIYKIVDNKFEYVKTLEYSTRCQGFSEDGKHLLLFIDNKGEIMVKNINSEYESSFKIKCINNPDGHIFQKEQYYFISTYSNFYILNTLNKKIEIIKTSCCAHYNGGDYIVYIRDENIYFVYPLETKLKKIICNLRRDELEDCTLYNLIHSFLL